MRPVLGGVLAFIPLVASAAPTIAVLPLDPLGLEPEIVARLETLFRLELERLAGVPVPARREIDRVMAADRKLRACEGELACLAQIGQALGAGLVVSGNVGALGDSFIINLKLIEVESRREVRRVSEPLSGSADALIEAVRVAAYRLVAPERLRGRVQILSDVSGARVWLDGKAAGLTPMSGAIEGLSVGSHKLRLSAPGYSDFLSDVEVRFEKTTQVIVHLVASNDPGSHDGPRPRTPTPWYTSAWGLAGIAAGAAVVGLVVGLTVAEDDFVRCQDEPQACGQPQP